MKLSDIALPIFVIAIVLELIIDIRKNKSRYKLGDTLANIYLGMQAAGLGLFSKSFQLGVYYAVYSYAPFKFENTWIMGPLCFLVNDLTHYWFHRLGHESRLFWSGHQTHHSSKLYNFSTAVRTPVHSIYKFFFWAPLAIFGFHPILILTMDYITLFWGFYVCINI